MKFGGCRNAPFFVATFQNLHIPNFRRIFEGNKSENRMPHLPRNKPRSQSGDRTPTGDKKFYNSLLWRKIRFGYIIENPVCEVHLTAGYLVDCTSGGVVDHLVSITNGGAKYDPQNMATMCATCHNRKSALEGHGLEIITALSAPNKVPGFGERERILLLIAKGLP